MLLDDLVSVIESHRERIRSHDVALRENETRTRMALIDPLLQALGWDVSDPAMVTPECKVSGSWADYALLNANGKPVAFLEAKRMHEPLSSHRKQMLGYCVESGVKYAGLTDGNHWELYDVFKAAPLEEKRILDISIAGAPAHECALKLLLLWRPNLVTGQPVPACEPIFGDAPVPTPMPANVEPIALTPRPESPDWVALSMYDLPAGTQCPAAIRFWDGSERKPKRWYEVLTLIIEKLHSEGLLTVDDAPIQSSSKTNVVNIEPVHPSGKPFGTHKKINGTPLFVNVHLNAWQARQNAKRLLKRYGRSPDDVYLQVEQ